MLVEVREFLKTTKKLVWEVGEFLKTTQRRVGCGEMFLRTIGNVVLEV